MKKFLFIIFLTFIFIFQSCFEFKDEGECKKTEAPEINFGFLLGGTVLIVETEGNEEYDVTADYFEKPFTISCYKVYCDGTNKGPFPQEFVLGFDGTLEKQSIGIYSFRMDNEEDYMNLIFYLNGEDAGSYKVYYNSLKSQDGGNAYVSLFIKLIHKGYYIELESITATVS